MLKDIVLRATALPLSSRQTLLGRILLTRRFMQPSRGESTMATPTSNEVCKSLKAFHIAGRPLVLANVYDGATAKVIAAMPSAKAIATASFAVAASAGVEDEMLTLEANLHAVRIIARIAHEVGKPLTVDFQDGYGDRLEEGINSLIDFGVSGCNLEDYDRGSLVMYPINNATSRIKRALEVAAKRGVRDFVINARVDILLHDGDMPEVLDRGKAYLDAGATSVFVLGGKRGITLHEIQEMVMAFDGRLNIGMPLVSGDLNVRTLAEIGVARISVGPQLHSVAMRGFKERAEMLLKL